ncbi:MAG: cell division protein FtsA [Clostridium sp.]
MSKHIVAIDIGESKVCASSGFIDSNGELQVHAIASAKCGGVKESKIVDIDKVVIAIERCKKQLENGMEESIEDVYIVIPSSICQYSKNKGVVSISPEVGVIKEKDIKRVLDAAKLMHVSKGMEVIEAIPNEYYIDGYKCYKDPIGTEALRFEVDALLVLAEAEALDNFIRSVNKAGMKVKGISLQIVAEAMACVSREQKKSGVAIIDVGAETVDICVYKNDKACYNFSMVIGGNNISKDISLCLKIPYNNAEDLKIKYGIVIDEDKRNELIKIKTSYDDIVSIKVGTLSEIIEARVEQILQIVKGYLEKNDLYDKIANIILLGGGITQYKSIINISEQIFNMPIEIGMSKHIGASNSIYTNVVGVLDDVTNSLVKDMNINNVYDTDHGIGNSKVNEDLDENKNNRSGIMNKIRGFFEEFF